MKALIGDYVTTSANTYEVSTTFDGVPVFNLCGIRQGIFTGWMFTSFETKLCGLEGPMFSIKGEKGTYATSGLDDFVVVTNPGSDIENKVKELEKTCFPMQMMKLLKSAYELGDRGGFSPSREDMLLLQEKFLKVWIQRHSR